MTRKQFATQWTDVLWTDILGHPHLLRTRLDPESWSQLRINAADVVVSHDGHARAPARPLGLQPDQATAYPSPWESDVSIVMADIVEVDGQPSSVCSRTALRQILDTAAGSGFEVMTAAELEFYLIDPLTLRPIFNEIANYSIIRGALLEDVLRPIRIDLATCDIPIEAMNPEYAGGQAEVNLRYGPALRSADRATLLRLLIRRAALRAGVRATFMAKPWRDQAGSGLHVHQSLWSEGRNLMSSGTKPGSLCLSYVAGLIEHTQRLSLLGSSTPNSFHRRADFSFAPTVVTWGSDNRTLSTRVVEGSPTATRVEQRDAAADANIYLVMAGQIAAGLDGVSRGLQPPPPSTGNAYADRSLPSVPRTFVEAFERFTTDIEVERLLPGGIITAYRDALEPELELAVTYPADWERDRYLDSV
jgi:glutamine synthetase